MLPASRSRYAADVNKTIYGLLNSVDRGPWDAMLSRFHRSRARTRLAITINLQSPLPWSPDSSPYFARTAGAPLSFQNTKQRGAWPRTMLRFALCGAPNSAAHFQNPEPRIFYEAFFFRGTARRRREKVVRGASSAARKDQRYPLPPAGSMSTGASWLLYFRFPNTRKSFSLCCLPGAQARGWGLCK